MSRLLVFGLATAAAAAFSIPFFGPEPDLLSDDPVIRGDAVEALRSEGRAGFDRLYAEVIDDHADDARWLRALDEVAAQRSAVHSGLYWHTDLDVAMDEAERQGKPILSLRLLGGLTEEYSCANSRFFRTLLYPDPEVGQALSEDFVLHWSTERPAPVMQVDFGDGRTLTRTLTGNSAHYVLDAEGRPLDVIPGLYGPAAFVQALDEASTLHALSRQGDFDQVLATFHRSRADRNIRSLQEDLSMVRGASVSEDAVRKWAGLADPAEELQLAALAMQRTYAKAMVEMPTLEELRLDSGSGSGAVAPTDSEWSQVASLRMPLVQLSSGTRALMAQDDGALDPVMEQTFVQAVANDTVRNELELHTRVRLWFAQGEVEDFETLNARIYAELFATPADDPWMGLHREYVFTGLDGAGVGTKAGSPG